MNNKNMKLISSFSLLLRHSCFSGKVQNFSRYLEPTIVTPLVNKYRLHHCGNSSVMLPPRIPFSNDFFFRQVSAKRD